MSSDILQKLGTVTLNNNHLSYLPRFSDLVPLSVPAPSPTVDATRVPALFREPYILSGYRPPLQDWRCYLLSLFQRHNESINVWTHLLAVPAILLCWWAKAGDLGYTLEIASLPLAVFLVSSLTYMTFSVAAHLLQSHSERSHYCFFFLDYVGVASYQYGCSLGHYFYSSEPAWKQSYVGRMFLPGAALFAWLSCAGCCFAKFRYRRPYPWQRKVFQLIPTSLAYLLDISPVAHRLATVPWSEEPSLPFHALQIASFLLAAVFFSCPVPERFFPGKCDFVGHGHQIFHLFLSLCTLFQLEALFRDYAKRRGTVVEMFGESQLWWACGSFPVLFLCCLVTSVAALGHMREQLQGSGKKNKE